MTHDEDVRLDCGVPPLTVRLTVTLPPLTNVYYHVEGPDCKRLQATLDELRIRYDALMREHEAVAVVRYARVERDGQQAVSEAYDYDVVEGLLR